jgi:hypothetical protein
MVSLSKAPPAPELLIKAQHAVIDVCVLFKALALWSLVIDATRKVVGVLHDGPIVFWSEIIE